MLFNSIDAATARAIAEHINDRLAKKTKDGADEER